MKNKELISGLFLNLTAVQGRYRIALVQSIVDAVTRMGKSDGKSISLNLQPYHMDQPDDDPARFLVECDRRNALLCRQPADRVVTDKPGTFYVVTENGLSESAYMSLEELADLYDEIGYIETESDPGYESGMLKIVDGEVSVRTTEN